MGKEISLIAFLDEVVSRNTQHYRKDFELDAQKLRDALNSPYMDERIFYFMSRPIVREKELCQRIDAAVEVWSKQAQQTQQYMKALEYVKTPPTPHTSNRWTVNEYGNHEMSNMVYRFSWREYEHTEWDRTLEKSVPKSWELTWSVTFNTPHNPDYSGDGWKIAGQDRKIFRDRASMEKYLQGRIAA